MYVKRKPVLNDSETYENINVTILSIGIGEKTVANTIMNIYNKDIFDMNADEIDFELVLNEVLKNILKTEKFEIVAKSFTYGYLEQITSSASFPALPIEVQFSYNFESNNDLNFYKLKNPKIYNRFMSERIYLMKKLGYGN
jgi:hypothetical protein